MENIKKIVINLEKNHDRFFNTLKELKKVGLSDMISRFDAMTPSRVKNTQFKYITVDAYNNIKNVNSTLILPNLNAVACAMSHIKVWYYILNNGIENALIMEDDIEITDSYLFKIFYTDIVKIINSTHKYNPLLITFNSIPINKKYKINNCIEEIKEPFCNLHFYYINNKMAQFLAKNIDRLKYQIDIEVGLLSKMDRCKFLNVSSDCVIQSKKFKSDIQFYRITPLEISKIFKLPIEICNIIYKFIPKCFKEKRCNQTDKIFKNYNLIN